MLVQSFCPNRSWFEDYVAFFAAAGLSGLEPDQLSQPRPVDGVALRVGWVADRLN